MGVGMILGMGVLGTMSDKNIKKHQAKGNAKPEHRLPLFLTVPGAILMPVGIFLYGWTTYYGVHWIVPIIGKSKPSQPSSYPLHVAYILTYLPKAPAASASAISRP
jgi:hypothetical protein